jgi:hypothetical protein
MEKLKEVDLAVPVIAWLEEQHWEVYQEVQFSSNRVDIAAVRNNLLWAIECKTSMTFSVLEQAWRWPVHFRSVAVPASKEERVFVYHIAKHLQVGVLTVGLDGWLDGKQYIKVEEVVDAPLIRLNHGYAKHLISKLLPEHKTSLAAGSAGGGYYTPYKATMDNVRRFIKEHPGCTLKDIMAGLDKYHYSNPTSAKTCIRKALADWESDWCEVEATGKEFTYRTRS